MSWISLGTRSPVYGEWSVFPIATDCELIKIAHTWVSTDWWKPRGLVAQVWQGVRLISPFKIYPRDGSIELRNLPIPTDFKLSGDSSLQTRYIGVYLLSPYQATNVTYQWSVSLEGFPPATIPQATNNVTWDDVYNLTGDDWNDFY